MNLYYTNGTYYLEMVGIEMQKAINYMNTYSDWLYSEVFESEDGDPVFIIENDDQEVKINDFKCI